MVALGLHQQNERGKSGHRRKGCPIAWGVSFKRNMESAAESKPPRIYFMVRVKGWCKRPPIFGENRGVCKPHPVQDRIGSEMCFASTEERVGCLTLMETFGLDKWPSLWC